MKQRSLFLIIVHTFLRIEGEDIGLKLSNIFLFPFLCKGITLSIVYNQETLLH